ncbi:MAG: 50S ribosomal protein L5 [Methanonatronarchaeales archaeon]|nr:50S ribosomal protein L5 [Methanonatronarchaeales archaeon]
MLKPRIGKVVVNVSVGEGGEELRAAEMVVEELTGRTPVRTRAKKSIRPFNIKKGEPIGCMVTLRGEEATSFLESALKAAEKNIELRSIDREGNFSLGVKEHTNFEGVEYDPEIGIHGLDVSVQMERPGYRVKRRRIRPSKVGSHHRLTPDDTAKFLDDEFGVEVER